MTDCPLTPEGASALVNGMMWLLGLLAIACLGWIATGVASNRAVMNRKIAAENAFRNHVDNDGEL